MSTGEFGTSEPETVEFSLRDGERIVFGPRGVRHPAALHQQRPVITDYETVTHVSVSTRSIRVGTERSVYILNRSAFKRDEDAEAFVAQLARRVAAAPGGEARLARMREIDRRAAQAGTQRVTWAFVALCGAVQVLQLFGNGVWEAVGEFSASAVAAGEIWRIVTANLLHAAPWLPVHFVLNTLALLALGALLEWTIGSARLALLMAVSGVCAMGAGLIVDYEHAMGASGIVMGVFGALVFLELRHGHELPAHWRLPRAVIWLGIALQAALELLAWAFFPVIATGAHVGGFVSGFLACAVIGPSGLRREPVPGWLRAANAVALGVLVLSAGTVVRGTFEGPLSQRADRLLARDGVPPQLLNNLAWMIATADAPSESDLDVALRLAERAVDETQRRDAGVLDTLAEVHFQRGESDEALEVIEEAMVLDPSEPYYQDQRERFLGRREAEDRPDPPALSPTPPRRGPIDPDAPEIPI